MPPKRKRAGDTTVETTRATRSSTRIKTPATDSAEQMDAIEEAPVTKKIRKAASKATTSRSRGRGKAQAVASEERTENPHGQEDTVAPAGSKSKPTKSSKPEAYSAQRAAALYSNYVDPDEPSVIGPEGFERLCSDMDISLEGALPLILAWQMKASEMAKITRSEWDVATAELQISSLQALSTALRDVEDALILGKAPSTSPPSAPMQAKKKGAMPSGPYNRSRYQIYATDAKKALGELYSFCFTLVKSPQGRNIDMETASAFWSVLLVPQYPLMSDLLEFINEKGSYKGVNKDLWNMTREFCQSVNRDLSDYEADGAWPTMIDDFVAWKNNKRADADITIERDTA